MVKRGSDANVRDDLKNISPHYLKIFGSQKRMKRMI